MIFLDASRSREDANLPDNGAASVAILGAVVKRPSQVGTLALATALGVTSSRNGANVLAKRISVGCEKVLASHNQVVGTLDDFCWVNLLVVGKAEVKGNHLFELLVRFL